MRVLLSIKPEFANKIFEGLKRYEYRKVSFKNKDVKTVLVYSTQPVGQIIGEFDILEILSDHPTELWETTQDGAGIDSAFYDQYFEGRDQAVAIKIGETRLYDTPKDPNEMFERFVAPQSFRYLAAE